MKLTPEQNEILREFQKVQDRMHAEFELAGIGDYPARAQTAAVDFTYAVWSKDLALAKQHLQTWKDVMKDHLSMRQPPCMRSRP